MYYPFLRAKQFELKAIREFFSIKEDKQNIIPIIEPVKSETGALKLAISELLENDSKFALILNPYEGDFKHHTKKFNAFTDIEDLSIHKEKWTPAFFVTSSTSEQSLHVIEENNLSDVMLVFNSEENLDKENIKSLIARSRYIVINSPSQVPEDFIRTLLQSQKSLIRLDDSFRSQVRNVDYLENIDEFFSDKLYHYKDQHYDGFSDYTSLPSKFVEGGVLPNALVIHLTYQYSDERINVHHFVSDTNFDNKDTASKFTEAAGKIEPFFKKYPHTKSVDELIERANANKGYPGLGYIKKLSILNHLELMNKLLMNR